MTLPRGRVYDVFLMRHGMLAADDVLRDTKLSESLKHSALEDKDQVEREKPLPKVKEPHICYARKNTLPHLTYLSGSSWGLLLTVTLYVHPLQVPCG